MSQHQFRVSTGAVNALAGAVVMSAGGIAVLQGELTVGSLLVLVCYFAALYSPIETLAYLSEGFASAAAGARRVLDMLDAHEFDVIDQPGAAPLPAPSISHGISVRLAGVTFGYEPGRPVLQDVSLVADPGEIVAVVGSTGAGKSTLVSLIPRFFDPWQGTVYFNEREIRSIQLASLRQQIAIVPQQPFLLPLTIAENIAYARPEASRAEIVAAAVAASADAFIQRLPRGYDTVIGERGATLSGGEKQRLSIARAFLKDAPILILDEPTSAVDAQTEACLMESLEHLMRGRTTFIIAHRLSTIRRADQILVLENGRCVERGGHDELLSLRGHYFRFHGSQVVRPGTTKIAALAQGSE
jgi:ATP-binding cassette subfamily B protein